MLNQLDLILYSYYNTKTLSPSGANPFVIKILNQTLSSVRCDPFYGKLNLNNTQKFGKDFTDNKQVAPMELISFYRYCFTTNGIAPKEQGGNIGVIPECPSIFRPYLSIATWD